MADDVPRVAEIMGIGRRFQKHVCDAGFEEGDVMAMATDPVCGMRIDTDDAAATAEYEGETYYFCSEACRQAFVAGPDSYGAVAMAGVEGDRFTEEELADRAGTTVEHVRDLADLGIIQSERGMFPRRDVVRVRVVVELEAKGMDAAALGAGVASEHLTLGYLESAGRRHPRSDRTFAQLGEDIGIPLETLQSLYVAFGLPQPRRDEHVREEDLPVLKA